TWLMIQRKLEHWLVLNLSNTFAIPLLIYKELELTALLTLIYFVIAILGYYKWKQTMKLKQP
ncbi:MAG TPA: nicotinamide mononucleotide transporter, partial [Chitinophagaceae bacterium]|nr:nicotinamide mononucleotide transporter [Chitinophagaceae bacterium]